jgi:predicted metal-dependent hydrolase
MEDGGRECNDSVVVVGSQMNDHMLDPTPSCRVGITVTPRRPDFEFDGLEHETPRAWHPAGIGATAFLEALSALAPVVEAFFVDDARRLLPRIPEEAQRVELEAFVRQEATHASMHAAFNRLLIRWGVPIDLAADSVLRWLAVVDWTSSDLRNAVAMAGEHFLGEIGNVILSRPELLDGVDPHIARLFRWHAYEEVEHKAVLFDAFHAARGHGLHAYAVRITGLWIALGLLALALPSISYRILASARAAQDLDAWRGLIRFVFGPGGMLRGRWRAVAAYHRWDFHPWRYLDNRRLLSKLRDTIVDPGWDVRAR